MSKIEDLVQDIPVWKMLMKTILSASLIGLVLTACAPAISPTVVHTPTLQMIQTQIVSREAQVQSVEIQVTNNEPVQVNAVVRRNLTDFYPSRTFCGVATRWLWNQGCPSSSRSCGCTSWRPDRIERMQIPTCS